MKIKPPTLSNSILILFLLVVFQLFFCTESYSFDVTPIKTILRFIFKEEKTTPLRKIHFPNHIPNPKIHFSNEINYLKRYQSLPKKPLVIISESKNAYTEASKIIIKNKPKVMVLLPQNDDQLQKVYKRSIVTLNDKKNIKKIKEFVSSEDSKISVDIKNFNSIYDGIKSTDSELIVIIGHSEDGKRISIYNNFIDISQFHKVCQDLSKQCLFLSCYSKDFNLNRTITSTEAINYWKGIQKISSIKKKLTVTDVINSVNDTRNKSPYKENIKISITITRRTGQGIILYDNYQEK